MLLTKQRTQDVMKLVLQQLTGKETKHMRSYYITTGEGRIFSRQH